MDPQHRDRMAFVRICSGKFEKDMLVHHPRMGRAVRMTRPHRLFARERDTATEAFPGDVIGLSNPGLFAIGDTVCTGEVFEFPRLPTFPPECFAILHNQTLSKSKHLNAGLAQLREEGIVHVFYALDQMRREPILAAVGELQFDVVAARLASEYGVETSIEPLPYMMAKWVEAPAPVLGQVSWLQSLRVRDAQARLVVLFSSAWEFNYIAEHNPLLRFTDAGGNSSPLA